MSNHLNFCRQMVKQFKTLDEEVLGKTQFGPALFLAQRSQKFVLPLGGWVLDDRELRALGDGVDLRLPFPVIALEYLPNEAEIGLGEARSSKRIVIASEEGDLIVIYPIAWDDEDAKWLAFPPVALKANDYFNEKPGINGKGVTINFLKSDARIPDSDYVDEVGVLLNFLNALQCSNVHIERSPAKKSSRKVKAALPFDDYHVLTVSASEKTCEQARIGGVHRSPREHLRRGHIRLLQSGKRVWVNAAVVGAGRGAGKIFKDYAIKQ